MLRVGLEHVEWPLDPASAKTRDERTLVRTLYPTPLTVDPRTNDVRRGLCTTWRSRDQRTWTLRCAHAAEIAASLRRSQSWMFSGARISARGTTLRVQLPYRWLRFPYALTAAQAAVRGLRGPFRVVHARPGRIVARRGVLTIEFEQVEAHRAALRFRRGELDEIPVALGDIRAAQLDPAVAPHARVRQLLAVDVVRFRGVPSRDLRDVYWHTAARADYDGLVPEAQAPAAVSLVPGWAPERAQASAYRAAKARIGELPRFPVALHADAGLSYGAALLSASWSDLGLDTSFATGGNAELVRVAAPYPQNEAILARLVPGAPFLGAGAQLELLRRTDTQLYDDARVVPIAWAVDARLVSPRVRGWREDALGEVDYSRVALDAR